jgi:hypothetical protein
VQLGAPTVKAAFVGAKFVSDGQIYRGQQRFLCVSRRSSVRKSFVPINIMCDVFASLGAGCM